MESSPNTLLKASSVTSLGQKYTDFDITAVFPEIDFAATWIKGSTQVAQRITITAIITKSLTRNLFTACAPPAEVVTSSTAFSFLLISSTSYSNPSSPSFLAIRSDIITSIRPIRDWNRPTAVDILNFPFPIPLL